MPVWRIRDARLLIGAGALTTASLGLSMVTLLLRVHASGAGPMAATILLLCLSGPAILTMGLAGSLADRYDSRRLLIVTLLLQTVALLALARWESLPATYACTVVAALASSLGMPVWTALLPHLGGDEHTPRLISAQQGLRAVAMPAGAGAAGIVVQTWGGPPALALAAALLLLALGVVLCVRTRRVPVEPEPIELLPIGALRTLRTHHVAFVLIVSLLPFIIAVEAVNAVEVFLVRDELGATPVEFGLAAVAAGIGAVIGAFIAGAVSNPARRIPATLTALFATALTQITQGLAPLFAVFLALCLVIGLALGLANALIFVVILDQAPRASHGRVIALISGLSRSGSVTAVVLGGALATALGPRLAYVSTGLLGLLTALAAAYAIRRAGRSVRAEQPTAL